MASQVNPSIPADGAAVPKADLRDNFLATRDEIDALQAGKLDSGMPIDMQDQVLARAKLEGFTEKSPSVRSEGGVLQLDIAAGNVFVTTLFEDITTIEFLNAPTGANASSVTLMIWQEHPTGGFTVTWPGNVRWPGGQQPTMTAAEHACDIYCFVQRADIWYGFVGGQDFR